MTINKYWVMFIAVLILFLILKANKKHHEAMKTYETTNSSNTTSLSDEASKKFANTMIQMSQLDVSVLSSVNERLEQSCSRNKFGLSEEACIQKIRTNKDACMQMTAREFPGQLSNTDRLEAVMSTYVNCLFITG